MLSINYYPLNEDISKYESINNYQNIFIEYSEKIPSLADALYQMFKSTGISDQKVYDITQYIIKKAEKIVRFNFDLIKEKYSMMTEIDAIIICSYSCEYEIDSNFSPYKILNINLNKENKSEGIQNISKYLFIFLKALRKLNRFFPKGKYVYRCINKKVN